MPSSFVRVLAPFALLALAACGRAPAPSLTTPAMASDPASARRARQTAALDPRPGDVRLAPDVLVRRLAPDLWLHVSLGELRGGSFYPSNGLLLEAAEGTILFDTAWNDAQTRALLDWAARDLRQPVRRAVATHSHEDRLGGIGALRERGIPVAALARSAQLARAAGRPAPDTVPGLADAARADTAGFELFFPGAGHTHDNIVAYFPRQGVLHGGCLIKPDTATTMGNVADADVANWPVAVARVRERYPEVRVVVPGHGAVGGAGALPWTERLVREKGAAGRGS
jgi:metallo-beta-lactamase class B